MFRFLDLLGAMDKRTRLPVSCSVRCRTTGKRERLPMAPDYKTGIIPKCVLS
jgi:hypothetical protein